MTDELETKEETCPSCGGPMAPGGFALACGPTSTTRIPLPSFCPSKECAKARSEAVIAKAVERGLIDP